MSEWRRQVIGRWIDKIRKFVHHTQDKSYDDISSYDLEKQLTSFTTNKTMYAILNHIIYGYLIPQLDEVDKIRYRKQIKYFALDACESDIPHKLGPQKWNNKKVILNASTNRIIDDYGFQLGNAKFLEKSGESFHKIYGLQLAKVIADNMRHAQKHNGILEINLSTDMGTEHNPNNIRNILLAGIKRNLEVSQKAKSWFNKKTKILYRFDRLYINVKCTFFIICFISILIKHNHIYAFLFKSNQNTF